MLSRPCSSVAEIGNNKIDIFFFRSFLSRQAFLVNFSFALVQFSKVSMLQILEKLKYDPNDERIQLEKHSDKIVLPEKILNELVNLQKLQDIEKLPHPLVFRISTPSNNAYVGVKEFHDLDNDSVFLTEDVRGRLGIQDAGATILSVELALNVSGDDVVEKAMIILEPMEKYQVNDWKTFLESTLSKSYTAVTTGDILTFNIEKFECELKVRSVKTSNHVRSVCVIDRDIDLEIYGDNAVDVPINGIQECEEASGEIRKGMTVKINIPENHVLKSDGDYAISNDQFVSGDRFEFATVNEGIKVGQAKYVYAFTDLKFEICDRYEKPEGVIPGTVKCENCGKAISPSSKVMHETFCLRNNIKCAQCGKTFRKAIPDKHWHCCSTFGDDAESKELHDRYMHERQTCECGYNGVTYSVCVHRNECLLSLHECRYCHLILPRGEECLESRYYSVSGHEWTCGSKTTECFKCGKIVRLRELDTHLKNHEFVEAEVSERTIQCSNVLCVNKFTGDNSIGLCTECFSPLYSDIRDDDGRRLKARIERRYILQLKNGCGDLQCDNQLCVSSSECICRGSMGEIIKFVKKWVSEGPYMFCVSRKMRELRKNKG